MNDHAEQTLKQVAHMLGVTGNLYRDVPLAIRALQVQLRDRAKLGAALTDEDIHEIMSQHVNCDYTEGLAFARALLVKVSA